ncbi:MAG: 6-phosphogluconolactonase [Thiomicrospira sp.]
MINLPSDWRLFDTPEALARSAVSKIMDCASEAIAQRGAFHLVTAGGTTPNACYSLLRNQNLSWSKWFIYMGDERVLPADHAERNSVALAQTWLSFGKIPAEQIFYMPTERGLEQAISAYREVVDRVPLFDLVLLGMGEDGHTASLFPQHNSLYERASVIGETNSPKPPKERVSLSYPRLNQSRQMLKLISGESKRDVVSQWRNGRASLPIAQCHAQGNTWVYLDKSCWSEDTV